MPTSGTWFDSPPCADDRGRRFVRAVASAAAGWGFGDLRPEDTSSGPTEAEGAGRLVEVTVPGLSTRCRMLWVLYEPDRGHLPVLASRWADERYPPDLDDYDLEAPDEEVDLWVSGVDASPEQCGAWAAAWLERSLRRPVRRREWDRPRSGPSTLLPGGSGRPALVEWTVGAPEHVLDAQGDLVWGWLRRQPPSREVQERPGPA